MAIIDLDAGEGFHYEKRELLWGDQSTMVDVKVPNKKPEIEWVEEPSKVPNSTKPTTNSSAPTPKEGFHYEQREMQNLDGSTTKVNTQVPNEKPKIMWDGADDTLTPEKPEAPDSPKVHDTPVAPEPPADPGEAPEGYHYEQRELLIGEGEVAIVNVKVPNERPKLVVAGFDDKESEESEADATDYGKEGSNNDGVQTGTYVCAGATLQCSFGVAPCNLVVLPYRTLMLGGKPMANIMDLTPANIQSFGMCTTQSNPAVAAATAAALGTPTPAPCVANAVGMWQPGKSNLMIDGQPALMNYCTCQCIWGGVITIKMDGQ